MNSDEIELSAQEQEQDEKANAKDRISRTEGDRTVDSPDLARPEEEAKGQEIKKEARSQNKAF